MKKVKIFHTDIGNEFKNKIIDQFLDTFGIQRLAFPYDNTMAEARYKIIKTKYAFDSIFKSLDQLKLE